MTNPVRPIGGPGSADISVQISLPDLQRRLIQANHPLASVPQWTGNSFYMVHVVSIDRVPEHCRGRVLLITCNSEERASECALANVRTRDDPSWQVETVRLVQLSNSNQLQTTLEV